MKNDNKSRHGFFACAGVIFLGVSRRASTRIGFGSRLLKRMGVELDTVLSDEIPPILRQKCSKCVSISPLSSLSRQKFIRLKLRRT